MTTIDAAGVVNEGTPMEERETRLASGAAALRADRGRGLFERDRILITIAAALMLLGLCAVLLGWWGASHATILEEQVPYLISGGLFGVALALIGAACLLAHWLTVLIRENRAHQADLADALRSIAARLDREENANGRTRGATPQRSVRRTPRRN
jgi:hypothetical protein